MWLGLSSTIQLSISFNHFEDFCYILHFSVELYIVSEEYWYSIIERIPCLWFAINIADSEGKICKDRSNVYGSGRWYCKVLMIVNMECFLRAAWIVFYEYSSNLLFVISKWCDYVKCMKASEEQGETQRLHSLQPIIIHSIVEHV